MQAIQTKWFGPGNVRGSRIKASCEAGSITVSWDHSSDVFHNHAEAARQLCIKLGWTNKYYGSLYGGAIPALPNGYVFVMVNDDDDRNVGTFAGYAPDVRCPHYEGSVTNNPPTTNDCTRCYEDRKGAAA